MEDCRYTDHGAVAVLRIAEISVNHFGVGILFPDVPRKRRSRRPDEGASHFPQTSGR